MKKILYISLFFVLLCINSLSYAIVTNSSLYSNVKVYVLYNEENGEYTQEKNLLNENVNIQKEYINVNEDEELYDKIKDALKIKKDKFPVTVIGATYFVGYNEKVQNSIKETIEIYDKADNYVDIVEKIKNNEDVSDDIKQKRSNILVISIVFLLVIFSFILLICIIKKNKRKKK